METIGMLLMVVGYLAAFICGLWMLIIAFQEGALQGILYMFVPFYSLYYVISRWEKCKQPFLYSLAGLAVAIIGLVMGGMGGAT